MTASRIPCRDCSVDTIAIGQWYMVEDQVWAAAGLGPDAGVLCLADLARRLDRALRADDFKPTDDANRHFWCGAVRLLPRA